MDRDQLVAQIVKKRSFLCVGLDTDPEKIPGFLHEYEDPIFEFNKRIIDATKDLAVAYKPNIAFYEAEGVKGWKSLMKTVNYIPDDCLKIADAKRGDIGNTSLKYGKAFFEIMPFDAVTAAPYMGSDSIKPFLEYRDKWVIVLGLTSNPGAMDFQFMDVGGEKLYEKVMKKVSLWGDVNSVMFVVGATRGEDIKTARKAAPDHFFLVPGIGKQGGSLGEVVKYGFNDSCGLLVNASRSILYAGSDRQFAQKAREAALELQREMESALINRGL